MLGISGFASQRGKAVLPGRKLGNLMQHWQLPRHAALITHASEPQLPKCPEYYLLRRYTEYMANDLGG
jgi:hypothetical protein